MLTSPITVTIDGVDHELSRINQDNFGAVYLKKAASLEIRMTIRHTYEKATALGQYERHNVDLQYTTFDVEGKPTTTQSYSVHRALRGSATKTLEDVIGGQSTFSIAHKADIASWES